MNRRKFLSGLFLFGVSGISAIAAIGDKPFYFVLAIRKDVYLAKRTKVRNVLADLWTNTQSGQPVEWKDSGWMLYRKKTDPSIKWVVYCVSKKQIKNRATAAKIASWLSDFNVPTNKAFADLVQDYDKFLDDNGIEPTKIPEQEGS